jgi:hypothetical protein
MSMKLTRRSALALGGALLSMSMAGSTLAADYPSKPITLDVS